MRGDMSPFRHCYCHRVYQVSLSKRTTSCLPVHNKVQNVRGLVREKTKNLDYSWKYRKEKEANHADNRKM